MLFNWNIPWLIQIVYISTADQSGHKRCYVYSVYLFRCLVEYQTFHSPQKNDRVRQYQGMALLSGLFRTDVFLLFSVNHSISIDFWSPLGKFTHHGPLARSVSYDS